MIVSFTREAMPVLPVVKGTSIRTFCNGTDAIVWRREWGGELGYYMPHVGMAGLEDRWVPLGDSDR